MSVFINSAYCVHGSTPLSFEHIKPLRQRRCSFDGRHHACQQRIDYLVLTTYQACRLPSSLFNHHSLQLITTLYLNGTNEKKRIFLIISPAVEGFFFVFSFVLALFLWYYLKKTFFFIFLTNKNEHLTINRLYATNQENEKASYRNNQSYNVNSKRPISIYFYYFKLVFNPYIMSVNRVNWAIRFYNANTHGSLSNYISKKIFIYAEKTTLVKRSIVLRR